MYSGAKSLTTAGLNVALGQDAGDALTNACTNFLFDVVGRVGANQIGQMYRFGKGDINYLTHKGLHAGLGAALGALEGDAAAGAIGAVIGEMVAESLVDLDEVTARVKEKVDGEQVPIGSDRFYEIAQGELRSAQYFGKLGAAFSVALAGHDVEVGMDVATNALENNFAVVVPLMIGGRILLQAAITGSRYALGVGSAVLVGKGASDAVDAYREGNASSSMDAHPEGAQWVDEGFEVEERGPQVLVTPFPEEVPDIEGYQPADIQSYDEGYTAHNGPNTSILSMGYDLDGNYVPKGKGSATTSQLDTTESGRIYGTHRELKRNEVIDSHHIIQHAAVKNIPGL